MRRRNVLKAIGAGAATLAAPVIRSAEAQAGKTLVIGGSVPLTGAAAETGLNVNNGYLTAATYFNEVLGGVGGKGAAAELVSHLEISRLRFGLLSAAHAACPRAERKSRTGSEKTRKRPRIGIRWRNGDPCFRAFLP